MEKRPTRTIFERSFFKDHIFRWNLRRIMSRVFNIKMKEAQNIIFNLRQFTDEECIEHIKNNVKSINNNKISTFKEQNNTNSIPCPSLTYVKIINNVKAKLYENNDHSENETYLDIGCQDGRITKAFSEVFGIDIKNTYGVDIDTFSVNLLPNIQEYNGMNLPFEDNSFDHITIFQTLHHVETRFLQTLLKEISRVIKTNGKLLIKEHDSDSKETLKLIEMEHLFFKIKNGNSYDTLQCKSEGLWEEVFESMNFVNIDSFRYSEDPTKSYYSLFEKL